MNAKDLARFESKYIPEPNSGCWLWLGSLTRLGYGLMHLIDRNRAAHRVSFIHFKGATKPGFEVQHNCDVRCCVNPNHLFLGTHLENMRASSARKRYPDRRGDLNHQAKLTEQGVREIRAAPLLKRGDLAKLACEYGVDSALITRIRDFRNWAHVK